MIEIDNIVFLEEVYADIKRGIDFYASQEEWVGDYFYDSLISDIESLHIYAGIHPQVNRFYRMLCHTFPFAIY